MRMAYMFNSHAPICKKQYSDKMIALTVLVFFIEFFKRIKFKSKPKPFEIEFSDFYHRQSVGIQAKIFKYLVFLRVS